MKNIELCVQLSAPAIVVLGALAGILPMTAGLILVWRRSLPTRLTPGRVATMNAAYPVDTVYSP